ncbi:MAG TPA: hypothetical protein VLS90_17325, partial [Thermodesulfobacteriota bacterium]|nr:hypothetical protein [Thermodesulfobacteriota bacterium]
MEAVRLAGVKTTPVLMPDKTLQGRISRIIETLPSQRKFVRGIFSGGTFALEAATTLTRIAGKVHTNVAIGEKIAEPRHSLEHSCIDL